MPKKVIYDPQKDDPPGRRPVRFPRPLDRGMRKASNGKGPRIETPELVGTWISPGINTISDEEWAFIASHPDTSAKMRRGVFQVIEPTLNLEAPTGTIEDYSPQDARDIILNTYDEEWLRLSATQDRRTEVQKWCLDQIKALKESMNRRAMANAS